MVPTHIATPDVGGKAKSLPIWAHRMAEVRQSLYRVWVHQMRGVRQLGQHVGTGLDTMAVALPAPVHMVAQKGKTWHWIHMALLVKDTTVSALLAPRHVVDRNRQVLMRGSPPTQRHHTRASTFTARQHHTQVQPLAVSILQ